MSFSWGGKYDIMLRLEIYLRFLEIWIFKILNSFSELS